MLLFLIKRLLVKMFCGKAFIINVFIMIWKNDFNNIFYNMPFRYKNVFSIIKITKNDI